MPEVNAETQVPAQVAPKDTGPLTTDQIVPTLVMMAVAMTGGVVSFYGKWKSGKVRFFNVMEFVGELVISGLCGVFAYWAFRGFNLNPYLVAAGVAIVGHMGPRSIFLVEQYFEKRFDVGRSARSGKAAE
jgi:hypothetical protein